MRRVTVLIAVLLASYLPSSAHIIPRVPLKDLFAEADVVAYIEILSGVYKEGLGAMYRARVIEMFKGGENQTEIIFGPFSSYRIGWQYLAFLSKREKPIETYWLSQSDDTKLLSLTEYTACFDILSEGMGMMAFDYKVDYREYGVDVESRAIVPKSLRKHTSKGFVEKNELAKYLLSLRSMQ